MVPDSAAKEDPVGFIGELPDLLATAAAQSAQIFNLTAEDLKKDRKRCKHLLKTFVV